MYKSLNKFSNVVLLFTIFIIIYMSSSYNISIMSGTFKIGISALCGAIIIITQRHSKFNTKLFGIVLLLSTNVLITTLLVGDTLKDALIMICVLLIALLVTNTLEFRRFCKVYTNVILLIAVFSLFTYFLGIIAPSLIRVFPSTYYRPSFETYNLGLSFINLNSNLIRNMGIFWEPGAFQTYLVFAFLLELFVLKSPRKIALLIYLFTIITTWSTTGMINAVILMLILVIYNNKNSIYKIPKIFIKLTFLVSVLVIIYLLMPIELQYAFLGKIIVYIKSDSNTMTSASVRFNSIIYPLKAFMRSPIIGIGEIGLRSSVLNINNQMATFTPVNWFASYGVLFGIIFIYAIYNLSIILHNDSKFLLFLIMLSILLSISTENYISNISIYIILFYGLFKKSIIR